MQIRRATLTDIDGINKLLYEVHKVHSDKRPDLFKVGSKKYTNEELAKIIVDDNRPIFVYVDNDDILGYAFCVFIKNNSNSLTDILSLYIDDLCVDENARGKRVGTSLYNYVLQFAKEVGCYNVTLNVWACNNSALKFYEKCGLSVQKIGMEKIL
ncbi:MAG: GNAT family N-acetyltransferase [Bacilli bacterium]|nr:GNAT family N-acetyltransferase [Bacilli bacterium]